MNCLIVSVDFGVQLLFMFLDLSNDWFMTVLKPPPIIIGESDRVEREVKKVWKKDVSSLFGP